MEEKLLEELKKLSILCVEDEEGIRKRLLNILGYYFDNIYEASSGREAYKLYEEHKPDIILTDIQMNDGDGISLVKKIRENDFFTKIVILTAFSSEEYLYNLINLDINHYILKPINTKKLQECLTKILRDKVHSILEISNSIFLDLSTREISYKDEKILIRRREKDFLALLHENRNKCVTSYFQIEERVWENTHMSASALKTFIKELRKKLPVDIIVNVPQEGYTLK